MVAPSKSEIPTPEALLKSPHRAEPTKPTAGSPMRWRNMVQSEIDYALYAGHLTPDQHCTLENFRQDLMKAGLMFTPRAGVEASGTSGHAQFIADTAFRRARRVKDQMTALAGSLTPSDMQLVLNTLMQDIRLPQGREDLIANAAEALAPCYL